MFDPGNAFRRVDGEVNADLFSDGDLPNAAGCAVLAKVLSGLK